MGDSKTLCVMCILSICTDVDECTGTPGICGGGTCVNTIGSYSCMCDEGYELNMTETECVSK